MALLGHKLCDICNKNRATIKLTRIDDDKTTEHLICQSCAVQISPLHKKSEEALFNLQGLFSNLFQSPDESAAKVTDSPEVCSACQTKFETYRKTFLLGCPECYTSFEEPLLADLRKIHGDIRHAGKAPKGHTPQQVTGKEEIAGLRRQLRDAVADEDFETAAELRDRIRRLEEESG